jgi:hypothetical protein
MLAFSQLEAFAVALTGEAAGPVRARLKQLQRLGLPFGANTGDRGRVRAVYDLDAAMLTGVCLTLVGEGLSVVRAAGLVRDGLFAIREAYVAAGATPGVRGVSGTGGAWLLIEQLVCDGGVRGRFDAIGELTTQDLETLRGSAQIVSTSILWSALLEIEGVERDEIVRQLRIVGDLIATADEMADQDISSVLARP